MPLPGAGAAAPAPERPPFTATVRPLSAAERAAMTPSVWRRGCLVALSRLRHVSLSHIGFGGARAAGSWW